MAQGKNEGVCMTKFIRSIFLTSAIISTFGSVFAKEHLLSVITNDEDQNTYNIVLVTDEHDVSVKQVSKNEFDQRGRTISQDKYNLNQLTSGVAMVVRKGYDIVKLKMSNLNESDSADLEMDVLVSALSKERISFDLEVKKEGSAWKLFLNGKSAKKLHFITNKKMLIGTVGIKNILVK